MRHVVVGLLVISLGGCRGGAPTAMVEGEVTLDEMPIEIGAILFVPTGEAGAVTGGAIERGKYRLDGKQSLTPGNYKVEIRANRKSGKQIKDSLSQAGAPIDEMVEAVAPQFNTNTELQVDIVPGANTKNFQVRSR